jgi:hypothetical protein
MNTDEFIWMEEQLEGLDAAMLGEAVFNPSAGCLAALPPGAADPCETIMPANPGEIWLNASGREQQAQWRRNDQEWMPAWD